MTSVVDPEVRPSILADPFRNVSPSWFAIVAFASFAPVVGSFGVHHHIWWIDYPGILFHLATFMLVAKLDAPAWAKSAGYGWLVLDVMVAILTLNNVAYAIYFPIRLGGHIFAGTWITMASLSSRGAMRIVGVITGVWLGGYSFVSPFVSNKALGPDSFLVLIWLAIIAFRFWGRKAPAAA